MTQNTHIQAQANLRKNTLKHTQEYKHSKIKYTQAHTHANKYKNTSTLKGQLQGHTAKLAVCQEHGKRVN